MTGRCNDESEYKCPPYACLLACSPEEESSSRSITNSSSRTSHARPAGCRRCHSVAIDDDLPKPKRTNGRQARPPHRTIEPKPLTTHLVVLHAYPVHGGIGDNLATSCRPDQSRLVPQRVTIFVLFVFAVFRALSIDGWEIFLNRSRIPGH